MTRIELQIEEGETTVALIASVNGHEVRTTKVPSSALEAEVTPLVRALVKGRADYPAEVAERTPEVPKPTAASFAFRCRGTKHLRLGLRPWGRATVKPGVREPCPGCPDCEPEEFPRIAELLDAQERAAALEQQLANTTQASDDTGLLERMHGQLSEICEKLDRLGLGEPEPIHPSPAWRTEQALRSLEDQGFFATPRSYADLFAELEARKCLNGCNSSHSRRQLVKRALGRTFEGRLSFRGHTNRRRIIVEPAR